MSEAPSNSAEAAAEPQDTNKGLLELLGDLREPQCPVVLEFRHHPHVSLLLQRDAWHSLGPPPAHLFSQTKRWKMKMRRKDNG